MKLSSWLVAVMCVSALAAAATSIHDHYKGRELALSDPTLTTWPTTDYKIKVSGRNVTVKRLDFHDATCFVRYRSISCIPKDSYPAGVDRGRRAGH